MALMKAQSAQAKSPWVAQPYRPAVEMSRTECIKERIANSPIKSSPM